MVYGKDCKGNFQSVVKLVKKFFIFPRIKNQRSMIYIENLLKQVKWLIDAEKSGIYFPQNDCYVQTAEMAKLLANTIDKKLYLSWFLGLGVRILTLFFGKAKKAW